MTNLDCWKQSRSFQLLSNSATTMKLGYVASFLQDLARSCKQVKARIDKISSIWILQSLLQDLARFLPDIVHESCKDSWNILACLCKIFTGTNLAWFLKFIAIVIIFITLESTTLYLVLLLKTCNIFVSTTQDHARFIMQDYA